MLPTHGLKSQAASAFHAMLLLSVVSSACGSEAAAPSYGKASGETTGSTTGTSGVVSGNGSSGQSTAASSVTGNTTGSMTTASSATTSLPVTATSTAIGSSASSMGGASGTASNVSSTSATSTTGPIVTDATPWLHVDGNKIKDPSGNEVVLRGVAMIDIGSLEEWDGGVLPMVDRLTDKNDTQGSSEGWYPKVLRLPVYPADSTDHDSPFTYQPGSSRFYDELLRPLVDYIGQLGMYAIIDWHYIDDTNQHVATTNAFWQDIAPRFADDSHVLFELFNEPINLQSGWPQVKTNMQTWYDTVRSAAPNNLVLIGTPNWCQLVGSAAQDPLNAANVAYVAHMYPMHWAEQSLRNEINSAAANVPVFVSEWGYEQGSDDVVDGNQTNYGDPFRAFIEERGLSWTAWVAHYSWFPSMFNEGWSLRVGNGAMGGFTKDWLYERRFDNLPMP